VATKNREPDDTPTHTPPQRFRAPNPMWQAYDNVCRRLGVTRTDDLIAHIREQITRHGTPEDLELLAEADRELAERRARKGGRPRTKPADT